MSRENAVAIFGEDAVARALADTTPARLSDAEKQQLIAGLQATFQNSRGNLPLVHSSSGHSSIQSASMR